MRPQRQVEIGYEVRQLFHIAPVEGDQTVAGIGVQRWAGHGLGAYGSLAGRDVIFRQTQVIEGPGQLTGGVDDALLVLEDEEPIGPEDVGPRGDGPGVETPRHGVGQDHPVDGLLEGPVMVQSRLKAVDRVAHQHEEAHVRRDAVQEFGCPGEGGVVGSPLSGDAPRPPGEPPGELLDGGRVECLVGHSIEQVALFGEMVRRRDAGVGGNKVVPPRGTGLLGTDAHEVRRAGHLARRYGRRGEIEVRFPRTEAPEAVKDQPAVCRAEAEEGLGKPGSPHDGGWAGMAAGCHTWRSGTIGRCPSGPELDGHPATADDQRMPERTSEAVAPPALRRSGFGGPSLSPRAEG